MNEVHVVVRKLCVPLAIGSVVVEQPQQQCWPSLAMRWWSQLSSLYGLSSHPSRQLVQLCSLRTSHQQPPWRDEFVDERDRAARPAHQVKAPVWVEHHLSAHGFFSYTGRRGCVVEIIWPGLIVDVVVAARNRPDVEEERRGEAELLVNDELWGGRRTRGTAGQNSRGAAHGDLGGSGEATEGGAGPRARRGGARRGGTRWGSRVRRRSATRWTSEAIGRRRRRWRRR